MAGLRGFFGLGVAAEPDDDEALLRDLRRRWEADAARQSGFVPSDEDFRRFLIARNKNAEKALAMLQAHAEWRASSIPVERTEAVEAVLASQRMGEMVGWTEDNSPILVMDCRWGKMLESVDEDDFINAMIILWERTLETMAERGSSSWVVVSIGGPPPMGLAQRMTKVMEANYPERLRKVVIAPIPSYVKAIVDNMLWFVPERTRQKFSIEADSAGMARVLRVDLSTLPLFLQDLTAFEEERMKAGVVTTTTLEDGSEQWMRSMVVDAGATLTVPFDVKSDMATVRFEVGVQGKSRVPGLGSVMSILKSFDVQFSVEFSPSGAGDAEEVLAAGLVTDLEHIWENAARREGILLFKVGNEHSTHFAKTVQLMQIGQLEL